MSPPDSTILSKSLTTITSQVLAQHEEAKFRTFMLRSMLKMDAQPTSSAVLEYHKHLLAEMEALAVSKATGVNAPKVRAVGAPSPGTSPKASGQPQASKPCKFFMGTSWCRRGPKCTFSHDMSGLPRQERNKKCLACGSEAHRQKDCPVAGGGSPKGKGQPGGGNTNNAAGHRPTTADQESTAVQPGASPGRAEDFTAFMRMMFAAASSSEAFPPASTPAAPAQPPAIVFCCLPLPSAQTIVPLGSVIQQLGYRLDWTASRCRLIAPSGRAFRLRVKGGCPEIMESEVSKLEEKRLEDLKSLEANVAEGTSRIRAVKALMSKGWWDHLQDYVSLGSTNSAQLALQAAPFLADVPQAALQGLVEDVAQVS